MNVLSIVGEYVYDVVVNLYRRTLAMKETVNHSVISTVTITTRFDLAKVFLKKRCKIYFHTVVS